MKKEIEEEIKTVTITDYEFAAKGARLNCELAKECNLDTETNLLLSIYVGLLMKRIFNREDKPTDE